MPDQYSTIPANATPALWLRYDEWRAARHVKFQQRHAHLLPGWHNRRGARRAVCILAVNVALLLTSAALSFFTQWFFVPFVLGVAGALASMYLLRVVSGSVADAPSAALDEIQLAQRHTARSMGFGILVALMFIPYFLLIGFYTVYIDDAVPAQFVYGCAVTLVTLLVSGSVFPTALAAWWTTDPDIDDDSATERTAR